MLKALSDAQKQLLTQATDKWTRIPARAAVATLDALEKRGLVEYRYHFNPGEDFHGWQWRATPAGLEARVLARMPTRRHASVDHLAILQSLGARFHGVSLEYRRGGTDWPAAWRARLVAPKNERDKYRVERFGNTAQSAVEALRDAVAEIDGEG